MLEEYQRVWNTHDAAAVGEFFTEDADMIIGNGPIIRGRRAIEKSWSGYFAHIDQGREGTFTIDSIRVIARDVAVLNVDSRTAGHTSAGDELPTRLARGTWVVVRHADSWLVSALRAGPAEGEDRTRAGVDR